MIARMSVNAWEYSCVNHANAWKARNMNKKDDKCQHNYKHTMYTKTRGQNILGVIVVGKGEILKCEYCDDIKFRVLHK
jgi:DNA-binding protein YbaB